MLGTCTKKVIDAQTVNATANVESVWLRAGDAESWRIWCHFFSSAGAVEVDVVLHFSPYDHHWLNTNSTSITTAHYEAVTLADDVATESQMIMYDSSDLTNDDLDYPCESLRIVVDGQAGNNADTVASVWVTKAEGEN